jgi:Na+-transporting methylmalonyl-CoA/oxaloacetate decarboxylase gamma subunit
MGTVLLVLVILAAVITIASGVWVATGLISAIASSEPKPPVPPQTQRCDQS